MKPNHPDRSSPRATRLTVAVFVVIATMLLMTGVALAIGAAPVTTANIPLAPTVTHFSNTATFTLACTDSDSATGTLHILADSGPDTPFPIDFPGNVGVSTTFYGAHTFGFYAEDSDGNAELPNTLLYFVDDTIAPTTASNAATSYANSAAITLTPSDNVGGSGVANTFYKMDGGATTTGTAPSAATYGAHSVQFWSVDVAGNKETTKTANFTITDTIAPATVSDAAGPYVNVAAVIHLTATDNVGGSGMTTGQAGTWYKVDGGATTTYSASLSVATPGAHTLSFWSKDAVGNKEATGTSSFVVNDTLPPATTVAPALSGTIHNGVSAALTAVDGSPSSGVKNVVYTVDGSVTTTATGASVSAIVFNTLGAHSVGYFSLDNSGNVEASHLATFSVDDTCAPWSYCDANDSYGGTATISIGATDTTVIQGNAYAFIGSGVKNIFYKLDTGAVTTYTAPVVTAKPGSHTLVFYSKDNANNTEVSQSAAFTVGDETPPVTSSNAKVAPANIYDMSAAISFTATDGANGSGVAATYYKVDTGAYAAGTACTVTGLGAHTVSFYSVDVAGNTESPSKTATFTISDLTAPSVLSDALSSYGAPADIVLTATDAGTGVAHVYYKLDGGATTPVTASGASFATTVHVAGNGDHTLEFWADDAGSPANASSHLTASFNIDIPAPADTVAPVTTSDAVASYVTSAVIHLSAADTGGSGVATTYYKVDSAASFTAGTVATVTGAGPHTLTFYSVDVAGNIETPAKTAAFTITLPPVVDTVAPVTASDAVTNYVGPAAAVIHLTATDAGSGVAVTCYSVNGGAVTTVTAPAPATVTVTGDGTYALTFWSIDAAGNIEGYKTADFTIATPVPPAVAVKLSKAPAGTRYTITRRRGTATFAYSATCLVASDSSPCVGRTVSLLKSADGITWSRVRGPAWTTDSNGQVAVSLAFKTAGSAWWKWSFAGDTEYLASSTSKTLITVR